MAARYRKDKVFFANDDAKDASVYLPPSYDSIYGERLSRSLSNRAQQRPNSTPQRPASVNLVDRRDRQPAKPRLTSVAERILANFEGSSGKRWPDQSVTHIPDVVNPKHTNPQKAMARWKDQSIICVTITPNSQGRYGFRVRGGVDLERPVTVGKVCPDSPADVCEPKLRPGDQIIYANGINVSGLTHEQVVSLIRESSFKVGELLLVIERKEWVESLVTPPSRTHIDTLTADQHIDSAIGSGGTTPGNGYDPWQVPASQPSRSSDCNVDIKYLGVY